MDDLVAFLRARLDEAEYAVRWCDEHGTDLMKAMQERFPILADVDAKRQIIDRHHPVDGEWGIVCAVCHTTSEDGDRKGEYPCETLILLALPFSGHPDYRKEWAV